MCASTRTTARCYVYRHVVGTPVEDDVLVYEEKDIGFYVAISSTQSAKFVLIDAHDHQTSEAHLIDCRRAATRRALVEPRQHRPRVFGRASRRQADHHDQLRRRGGLPHRRGAGVAHRHGELARDRSAPARASRSSTRIFYRDHMVRLERENGLPRIVVRRFADGAEHAIAFAEEAYALGMSRRLRVRHDDDCASSTRR